jgi:hypothetical protein
LKVAEAEGVGPVGGERSVGRRGRRKRFGGGGGGKKKKKKPYTLLSFNSSDFSFIIFFSKSQ